MVTVALDAMGGDFGPRITVPAAVQALLHYPDLKIVLVGEQTQLQSQLDQFTDAPLERLSIKHASRTISEHDKPSVVLRNSDDTSMRIVLDLVAEQQADAAVSGGNTGALMALSKFRLKLLEGIDRPALISQLPTPSNQPAWMLDLGANVSVDAETLFQFAVMGASLAQTQTSFSVNETQDKSSTQSLTTAPKVALLNIGEEKMKGNDVVKHCSELLTQTQSINYIGYIEGHQIFTNKADVIVCDGFVGNVCLKSCEGVARLFLQQIRQHLGLSKWKLWLAKLLFSSLWQDLDRLRPDQYNGASLLGLRGIVVKSHGNADQQAVVHAIAEAMLQVKQQVPNRISQGLSMALLERQDRIYE